MKNRATGNGHKRGAPWPATGTSRAQLVSVTTMAAAPVGAGRILTCWPPSRLHLYTTGPPRPDPRVLARACFLRTGLHAAPGMRRAPHPTLPHRGAPRLVRPGDYTAAAKVHRNACATGIIASAVTGEKHSADPRTAGALSCAPKHTESGGGGGGRTRACRIEMCRGECA